MALRTVGQAQRKAMFKNLRTGTKLIILCSTFLIAIGVTVYGLVAEKRIAINFARKELVGNQYLTTLREVYTAILTTWTNGSPGGKTIGSADEVLKTLSSAGANADGILQTRESRQALAAALSDLWAGKAQGVDADALVLDALAKGRSLASRIGDDSNLALDPELDSYYLQDILVRQMPKLFSQLGEVWSLASTSAPASAPEEKARLLTRAAIARSTAEELAQSLTSAYRGNASGSLRQRTEGTMAVMLSSVTAYLGAADDSLTQPDTFDRASLEPLWKSAADDALTAWAGGLPDLGGLLT